MVLTNMDKKKNITIEDAKKAFKGLAEEIKDTPVNSDYWDKEDALMEESSKQHKLEQNSIKMSSEKFKKKFNFRE